MSYPDPAINKEHDYITAVGKAILTSQRIYQFVFLRRKRKLTPHDHSKLDCQMEYAYPHLDSRCSRFRYPLWQIREEIYPVNTQVCCKLTITQNYSLASSLARKTPKSEMNMIHSTVSRSKLSYESFGGWLKVSNASISLVPQLPLLSLTIPTLVILTGSKRLFRDLSSFSNVPCLESTSKAIGKSPTWWNSSIISS